MGRLRSCEVSLSASAVRRVEVSTDGGASWIEAPLVGPDLGRFAWRLFQVKLNLAPGQYTLMSRAYNDQDEVQPESRHDNERGYGHNGWRDHALKVTVKDQRARPDQPVAQPKAQSSTPTSSAPQPAKERPKATLSPEAARGREVFLKQSAPPCGVCHRLDDAGTQGQIGPHLDELKPSLDQIGARSQRDLGRCLLNLS